MITLTQIATGKGRTTCWLLESKKGILACVHGKKGRLAVEAAVPSMRFEPWWSIVEQRNRVRGHLRACGVVLGKYSD